MVLFLAIILMIYFLLGNESRKGIQFTNPHIENIILAGFPYPSRMNKTKTKKQNGNINYKTKFSILLIDTNNDPGKGLTQVVDSFAMSMFYKKFLDWTRNDQSINLTIKPKKLHFLENISGNLETIKDLERTTNRCHLVNEPKGKMVSNYLQDVDMVVCISFNMPSAVMKAVTHGTRSVFGIMEICVFVNQNYINGERIKSSFLIWMKCYQDSNFTKILLKNILISVIGQNIWMILILFVTIVEEKESGLIFVG